MRVVAAMHWLVAWGPEGAGPVRRHSPEVVSGQAGVTQYRPSTERDNLADVSENCRWQSERDYAVRMFVIASSFDEYFSV